MAVDPSNPFASPLAVEEPPPGDSVGPVGDAGAMQKVRTGLLLVYIALCGLIISTVSIGAFAAIAVNTGNDAMLAALSIGGFAVFGFYLAGLVGNAMCIATPSATRARPLAIASLVLQVTAVLINIGLIFVARFGSEAATSVGQVLTNTMSFASAVCFLIFMWRVAVYIKNASVERRARRTLIVGILFLTVIGAAFAFLSVGLSEVAGGLLMLVGGVGALVAMVMYANTVTYLRKAIDDAMA